ncbi:MAG TPA: hypothetical protein VGH89_25050 [Pseudonocardia sp.]|jgi:hypothetical protein
MSRPALTRVPESIAVVTLALGVALTVAPGKVGPAAGLGNRKSVALSIGLMDLALVPGLLRGQPRWPWMLGRAAFNLPVAAAFRAEAARPAGARIARPGMYAMLALTTMDIATALALRNAERS